MKDGVFTIREPKISDPFCEVWEDENSQIISWLINSMQGKINKLLLFLSIAKEVWAAVS